MEALAERLAGGIVGLLAGDALGVPYEFHRAEALPPSERLEMVPAGGHEEEALEFHVRPDEEPAGRGSGYVVDALRSARMCAAEASFEAAVRRAVALGDDTDTTACLTGGVVGLRDGLGAIPARWREALRGRELWEPLLARLVGHRARPG